MSSLEPVLNTNTHISEKVEKWSSRVRERTVSWMRKTLRVGLGWNKDSLTYRLTSQLVGLGPKSLRKQSAGGQWCGFHTLLQSHISAAASDFLDISLKVKTARGNTDSLSIRPLQVLWNQFAAWYVRLRKSLLSTLSWLTMFDVPGKKCW